jgi:chromodomain-containing protein
MSLEMESQLEIVENSSVSENLYVVEHIQGKRIKKDNVEYLVKWLGYAEK